MAKSEKVPELEHTPTTRLKVKARHVKMLDPETAEIEIEVRLLTEDQHKVMRQLFPDILEKAYELLDKQALLAAIV
jgi:hypothetical protein